MTVVKFKPKADSFDEFWWVFPKKVGKPLAQAKWDHIVNGGLHTRILDRNSGTYERVTLQATPAEIIAGAKRYRASQIDPKKCCADDIHIVLKENGVYTCQPATWLNQGRWMDE